MCTRVNGSIFGIWALFVIRSVLVSCYHMSLRSKLVPLLKMFTPLRASSGMALNCGCLLFCFLLFEVAPGQLVACVPGLANQCVF